MRDEEVTKKFSEHVLAAGITDVEVRPYSEEQLEALFLERLVVDFDYVLCVTITSQRSPIFATAQKFSFQIITKYKAVRQTAGVPGPRLHHADAVGEVGRLFQVVSDQQDGCSHCHSLPKERLDPNDRFLI